MASPQRLAVKLCSISPRSLQNGTKLSPFLSPTTPVRDICNKQENRLCAFNIDTPNRRNLLKDGLPNQCRTVLGSGGFGTVYKAFYKGNQVAAKVIRTGKWTDAIINSEKHASFLRHSNIVRVLTIEQGVSLSLITMELCGTTLQDRLDETGLIKEERTCILGDISCALQFCHNAGIVHADVKPKNILMAANNQPKLTDFGSSVLITESHQTQELRGTPGYMAPEVIRGNLPTPAADIYSLGIVAWQMVSRKLPFAGLHTHTIIYLSAKGIRPDNDNIDDEFDGKYRKLYQEMWSQNVSRRPTTDEIIESLNTLIG